MKRLTRTTGGMAAMALAWSAASPAQVPRSGGGEAQKIMQEYQKVAGEKAALQAQVAQLQKDLEAAKNESASLKKERDALKVRAAGAASQAQIAQLNAAKEAAERSVTQSKDRMNELVGRFRETATTLRDVEADRGKLRKTLEERNAAYDKCADANAQLVEINGEILDRYEHVGLFTKASAAEPFTRITRTRLENLADEYRQRADALRVNKRTP